MLVEGHGDEVAAVDVAPVLQGRGVQNKREEEELERKKGSGLKREEKKEREKREELKEEEGRKRRKREEEGALTRLCGKLEWPCDGKTGGGVGDIVAMVVMVVVVVVMNVQGHGDGGDDECVLFLSTLFSIHCWHCNRLHLPPVCHCLSLVVLCHCLERRLESELEGAGALEEVASLVSGGGRQYHM